MTDTVKKRRDEVRPGDVIQSSHGYRLLVTKVDDSAEVRTDDRYVGFTGHLHANTERPTRTERYPAGSLVDVEVPEKQPVNLDALWREDATEDEHLDALQDAVNSGVAWRLEGSVGRAAMNAIEAGLVALGETAQTDYWGNTIPSRYEVEPGTKGSVEFVVEKSGREVS